MNAHIRVGDQIFNTAHIVTVKWFPKKDAVQIFTTIPTLVYTLTEMEAFAFMDQYEALTGTVDAVDAYIKKADIPDEDDNEAFGA